MIELLTIILAKTGNYTPKKQPVTDLDFIDEQTEDSLFAIATPEPMTHKSITPDYSRNVIFIQENISLQCLPVIIVRT